MGSGIFCDSKSTKSEPLPFSMLQPTFFLQNLLEKVNVFINEPTFPQKPLFFINFRLGTVHTNSVLLQGWLGGKSKLDEHHRIKIVNELLGTAAWSMSAALNMPLSVLTV